MEVIPNTCESVDSTNIHGTRATNSFATGSSEGQCGVHLVLDFDKGVQDHGSASAQVDLVFLHLRLVAGFVGVPSVHGKLLYLGSPQTCHIG